MKKLEDLAPVTYLPALIERKTELERLIKLKKASIERAKNLENAGHIRIVPHFKSLQFYLITEKGDTRGKYLSRNQNEFAKSLVKYDYEKKSLSAMQKELNQIKRLIQFVKKHSVENIYKRFSSHRQTLVDAVTLTDEEYANKWKSIEYKSNPYEFGDAEYYTVKGERVRSKSEVIIANMLGQNKVPYKYEYPVALSKSNHIVYPDFCCLNLSNRKEIFWEHFGLLDKDEYAQNVCLKLSQYSENEILPGKNLIITFETADNPLNIKHVEQIIRQNLI